MSDPFFVRLPWRVDVEGLAVFIDPDLHVRGEYVSGWGVGASSEMALYPPRIVLREYDDRVLVHEILHHLFNRWYDDIEDEHQVIWAVTELVLAAPSILGVVSVKPESPLD